MRDQVTLVVELGSLVRDAEARGDASGASTLRDAIAAIMEAASMLARTERRKAADRDRKRVERPPVSVESVESVETRESVESVESAPSVESVDPPRSEVPPDPLLTHTPATHTLTRAREETPGPGIGEISLSLLTAQLGAEGIAVVDEFLSAIRTRNSDGWYRELLRIVGPATGIEPGDLVQGIRDAMLVEPIVKQPGPLTTFVQFRKRERQREAALAPDRGGVSHVILSGRQSGKTAAAEAGKAFAQITALVQSTVTPGNGTRRFIARVDVARLGKRVGDAYDRVGGADRFLHCPGDKIGLLLRDFSDAYNALPPDEDDNPQTVRTA